MVIKLLIKILLGNKHSLTTTVKLKGKVYLLNIEEYKSVKNEHLNSLLQRTAQELSIQEQYVGKCTYCNKNNEIQSSIGIIPKFCMECGKPIIYQKSHFV